MENRAKPMTKDEKTRRMQQMLSNSWLHTSYVNRIIWGLRIQFKFKNFSKFEAKVEIFEFKKQRSKSTDYYQKTTEDSLNLHSGPPVISGAESGSKSSPSLACQPHHSHGRLSSRHSRIRCCCGGCSHCNCVLALFMVCFGNV